MNHAPPAVLLAQDIAGKIGQLAEHLREASPDLAARILAPVLDVDDGVLGRLSHLLATASYYARDHQLVPAPAEELWRDLALAANRIHDIALDLDAWREDLTHLASTTDSTASLPPGARPGPSQATSPGRRR